VVAPQPAQAGDIQDLPMKNFSLTTLMYHYVHAPGDRAEAGSGIPGLAPERFAAQLDYFAQHYTMIAWPDLQAHLLGQRALPPNACLLTFDDGTCDHYINVLPSLHTRGLSGLFFVLARQPGDGLALGHKIHFLLARLGVAGLRAAIWEMLPPEQQLAYTHAEIYYLARGQESAVDLLKSVLQRDLSIPADRILSELIAEHIGDEAQIAGEYYLTNEQIAEMQAQGMHFGGHSRSHPWFDWISPEQQADEIMASAAWLGTITPGPFPFAYPYGGYNAVSARLLSTHGFAGAFTTIRRVQQSDQFFIGRFDGEALDDDRRPTTA
jgi:peptidoglycan/xylan/chitin deacetylase (PgdA/CDA1 family)